MVADFSYGFTQVPVLWEIDLKLPEDNFTPTTANIPNLCLTNQANLDRLSSMTEGEKSSLGTYLRALRDAKGMSLRLVEERIGVSNAFLSQLESGKVKQPSPSILYKLAQLYGVPYETLMERAGYPVPKSASGSPNTTSGIFSRLGPITDEEEQALLDYLAFIRNRSKRQGG